MHLSGAIDNEADLSYFGHVKTILNYARSSHRALKQVQGVFAKIAQEAGLPARIAAWRDAAMTPFATVVSCALVRKRQPVQGWRAGQKECRRSSRRRPPFRPAGRRQCRRPSPRAAGPAS